MIRDLVVYDRLPVQQLMEPTNGRHLRGDAGEFDVEGDDASETARAGSVTRQSSPTPD